MAFTKVPGFPSQNGFHFPAITPPARGRTARSGNPVLQKVVER